MRIIEINGWRKMKIIERKGWRRMKISEINGWGRMKIIETKEASGSGENEELVQRVSGRGGAIQVA